MAQTNKSKALQAARAAALGITPHEQDVRKMAELIVQQANERGMGGDVIKWVEKLNEKLTVKMPVPVSVPVAEFRTTARLDISQADYDILVNAGRTEFNRYVTDLNERLKTAGIPLVFSGVGSYDYGVQQGQVVLPPVVSTVTVEGGN